jgi:hypothetical protein
MFVRSNRLLRRATDALISSKRKFVLGVFRESRQAFCGLSSPTKRPEKIHAAGLFRNGAQATLIVLPSNESADADFLHEGRKDREAKTVRSFFDH